MKDFAQFAVAAFVASLAIEGVDAFAGRQSAWVLALITLLLYLMFAAGKLPGAKSGTAFSIRGAGLEPG